MSFSIIPMYCRQTQIFWILQTYQMPKGVLLYTSSSLEQLQCIIRLTKRYTWFWWKCWVFHLSWMAVFGFFCSLYSLSHTHAQHTLTHFPDTGFLQKWPNNVITGCYILITLDYFSWQSKGNSYLPFSHYFPFVIC